MNRESFCKSFGEQIMTKYEGTDMQINHGKSPEKLTRSAAGCYKSHRIHKQILEDILEGKFNELERLPSIKNLCTLYVSDYRTIVKVLQKLMADEVLSSDRHTLSSSVKNFDRKLSSSINLITFGNENRQLRNLTIRDEEMIRSFERECSEQGVNHALFLQIPTADKFYVLDGPQMSIKGICTRNTPIGILTVNLNSFLTRQVVAEAQKYNIPVATLNDWDPESSVSRYPLHRVFQMGMSQTASKTIASHLIHSGHKKMVYISIYHDTPWSKNRLAGLIKTAHAKGLNDCIIPVCSDEYNELVARKSYLPEKETALDALLSELEKSGQPDRRMLHATLTQTYASLISHFDNQAIAFACEASFNRALEHKDATAWVCANDNIAGFALDFLAKKGRNVPKDISIVSYDDSSIAHAKRLTSYSFNSTGVIKAMVSHVLNPELTHRIAPDKEIITIPGFLTQRESCAPRTTR